MSEHPTSLPETPLDAAVDAVRRAVDERPAAADEAALGRVWTRLQEASRRAGEVLDCEDLQALLPAYRRHELPAERRDLLAAHLRSCLACRRELRRLETVAAAPAAAGPQGWWTGRRLGWAVAAALVLGLGLVQLVVVRQMWPSGPGADAALRVLEGALYTLDGSQARPVALGSQVAYGELLLTPRGTTALVELADGSRVELRERTRLAVTGEGPDTTLRLTGGDLIVEAADQRQGHLYVATDDCLVSVTGTVFAVSDGLKGSRVSVYEGEVQVAQAGRERAVLAPGDQVTTHVSVAATRLDREIAWSAHQERHLALLRELADLGEELAGLPRAEARHDSALLPRMPESTVFYVALPNNSSLWQQGAVRLRERLSGHELLGSWWQSEAEHERLLSLAEGLAGAAASLGEELVVVGWQDPAGAVVGPSLVAEVSRPEIFLGDLERELAGLPAEVAAAVRLVDDPMASDLPEDDALLVWVGQESMVAAPGGRALREMAHALSAGPSGFTTSRLGQALAERYGHGVESVAGVDLGRLVAREDGSGRGLELSGLDQADTLVVEQWSEGEATRRQAVLRFAGARHGMAAWLAAPAPLRSLSFVTADATSVAAFAVEEPRVLLADLLGLLGPEERAEAEASLEELEAEHGWSLRELVAALGGEVALAIDGPLAPQPSWKVVIEVYDATRVQAELERIAGDLAARFAAEGEGDLELSPAAIGSREAWRIVRRRPAGLDTEVLYTYEDGFLVAAPSEALLERALRARASGVNLLSSSRLRSLLPADQEDDFSALWFHDLSDVADALARLGGDLSQLPPEIRESLDGMGAALGPTLAWAYGEADSIRVSATTERDPMALFRLLVMGSLAAG